MILKEKIPYPDIVQFLTEGRVPPKLDQLTELMPGYGIFSSLQRLYDPSVPHSSNLEFTFNRAEQYLEDYFSGNLNIETANHLVQLLVISKTNYRKLIYKINENAQALELAAKSFVQVHPLSQKIKWPEILRKPEGENGSRYKKTRYVLLAAAAVVFVIFLLPRFYQQNLKDYYNFDRQIPLEYDHSFSRNAQENTDINTKIKQIDIKFNKGISEYLLKNYSGALKEWRGIESMLGQLTRETAYDRDYADQIYLFKAVSQIALALSDIVSLSADEKKGLLGEALLLFQNINMDRDSEKYFFALTLSLTGNVQMARPLLLSVPDSSAFYPKGSALLELIGR